MATNACQIILPQSATTLGRHRSKLAVKTCFCWTVLVATNECQIILPQSATALGRQWSKLAVKMWLSAMCLVVTKYLRQYATSAGFECNIINGAWIGCLTCIFPAAENYPGGLCSESGILVVRFSWVVLSNGHGARWGPLQLVEQKQDMCILKPFSFFHVYSWPAAKSVLRTLVTGLLDLKKSS